MITAKQITVAELLAKLHELDGSLPVWMAEGGIMFECSGVHSSDNLEGEMYAVLEMQYPVEEELKSEGKR